MKKPILRLFLFILLTLPCLIPILLCRLWLDTDIGCFGTLFPSQSQIEERTHVMFPPGTTNLRWRCVAALDADSVYMRFNITPNDMERLIQDTPNYQEWHFQTSHLRYFFDSFESFGDVPTEETLEVYRTWQGSTRCGWTNNLADMDDPDVYTIYVVYSDIEHCELYSQMATHFAVQATQSAVPNPTR